MMSDLRAPLLPPTLQLQRRALLVGAQPREGERDAPPQRQPTAAPTGSSRCPSRHLAPPLRRVLDLKSALPASIMFRRSLLLRATSTASSPLSNPGGLHGRSPTEKLWKRKPLFRRGGDDVTFRSGDEAVKLLIAEKKRRDPHHTAFVEGFSGFVGTLAPLLDRVPKYAWVVKNLAEPERYITFRVAWMDDMGISRVNRGYRVQFSSALGPYEGSLNFSANTNTSLMKSMGFDAIMTNALVGGVGGACGGADFEPAGKSEAEIQRFCQSYMTELSKYIGPDVDHPLMGTGVGASEVGYLYGQYKRINHHVTKAGAGLLWAGVPAYPMAAGYGVVAFAVRMLEDKGETLSGKRCVVTGSGKVAVAVAEKLIANGATVVSMSDQSGYVYEPQGFTAANFETLKQIKRERGARVGRYIMSSTTAAFGPAPEIFDAAEDVDYVFPCASIKEIDLDLANKLLDKGVKGVFEGAHRPCDYEARTAIKRRGAMFAPYRATLAGASLTSGTSLEAEPLKDGETLDDRIEAKMRKVYDEVKATAAEFNAGGDLDLGTNIASFLKVGNAMLAHGTV